MSHTAESIKKHIRFYLIIGAALLILTYLTVYVSGHHFGAEGSNIGNITVALIIASLKAGLVAAIFMHLFWDMLVKMQVIFKILIFTVVFFVGLFALTLWSMHDEVRSERKIPNYEQHVP